MDVNLVLVRESGVANSVRMKRNRMIIGRKPECEIRIPVGSVSREHCEIAQESTGLRIRDLGSSNGTYVDGQRVQEAWLGAGSIVTVGPATFVIQVDGKPEKIDAADALKRGAAAAAATASPAPAARPAAPAKPPVSKVGGAAAGAAAAGAAAGAGKPAPKKKDPEDSDFDFGLDEDDGSSMGDVDFSDLLKDDEDEQPKL